MVRIIVGLQRGAYQINVFSYRCDEHRQKFPFEIVFQRNVKVKNVLSRYKINTKNVIISTNFVVNDM